MKMFCEVRYDFYDEIAGVYCIDAWLTDNDNEEGKVVATFNPENGEVVYFEECAKTDEMVANAIHLLEKEYKFK